MKEIIQDAVDKMEDKDLLEAVIFTMAKAEDGEHVNCNIVATHQVSSTQMAHACMSFSIATLVQSGAGALIDELVASVKDQLGIETPKPTASRIVGMDGKPILS